MWNPALIVTDATQGNLNVLIVLTKSRTTNTLILFPVSVTNNSRDTQCKGTFNPVGEKRDPWDAYLKKSTHCTPPSPNMCTSVNHSPWQQRGVLVGVLASHPPHPPAPLIRLRGRQPRWPSTAWWHAWLSESTFYTWSSRPRSAPGSLLSSGPVPVTMTHYIIIPLRSMQLGYVQT